MIIKDIDQPSGEKPKQKAKSQKTAPRSKEPASQLSDPLMKEPIKSFLSRAQQELRVYIALENAWPRKRDGKIEKDDIPQGIIERLVDKNGKYQSPQFQKMFKKMWDDSKTKDRMTKYVSVCCAMNRVLIALLPRRRSTKLQPSSGKS